MLEGLQDLLREAGTPLLIVAILGIAFFYLRTKGTKLSSVADFDKRIRDGLPTIVEFYSNT